MSKTIPDNVTDDPRPQPPEEPGPHDCCHSGCAWCVYDLYYEDLERYRTALAAWEDRQRVRMEDPDSCHVSERTEGNTGGG